MKFPLILFCAFLLCSCGPLVPVVQENPKMPKPVAVIQTDQVDIRVQHLGRQGGMWIFDVEIENRTGDSLAFNDRNISCYASPRMFPLPDERLHEKSWKNSQSNPRRTFALGGRDVTRRIEQHIRQQKALQVTAAVVAVGLVVADAAADAKDNNKERWTVNDERNYVTRKNLTGAGLVTTNLMYQSADQARWYGEQDLNYLEGELIASQALTPSEIRRGKICLPGNEGFRYVRLVIPIGSREYVVDFKRRLAQGIQPSEDLIPYVPEN